MLRAFALIALGGAIGAVLRHGVSISLSAWTLSFPWHTLAVNLIGSFLIGLALPALLHRTQMQVFAVTGILGGFTTFSTFSLETVALIQDDRPLAAMLYAGLSVGGGLVLAAIGFWAGRMLFPPQP